MERIHSSLVCSHWNPFLAALTAVLWFYSHLLPPGVLDRYLFVHLVVVCFLQGRPATLFTAHVHHENCADGKFPGKRMDPWYKMML